MEFLGGSAGKESTCNAGDLDLIPGLGRVPWRRERLPTPVFWPGEFHELYSPWGHKKSDVTERVSLSLSFGVLYFTRTVGSEAGPLFSKHKNMIFCHLAQGYFCSKAFIIMQPKLMGWIHKYEYQLIYRGGKKNVSLRLESLALLVETLPSSIFRSDGNPISNHMVAW